MKKILTTINNIIALRVINLNLIKFLWNECDIFISRRSHDLDTGAFYFGDIAPRIELSKHKNKEGLITTLLHEVGHYKDYLRYDAWYEDMDLKKQEKSAWKWAIKFAKQYKLPMDYKTALFCLNTYGTTYRCLENKAGAVYLDSSKRLNKRHYKQFNRT